MGIRMNWRTLFIAFSCLGFFWLGDAYAQSTYEPFRFTTLAGSTTAGSTDGTADTARFNRPAGLCFDSSGNLYIADSLNYTIRKIDRMGITTTLAGSPGVPGSTNGTGNAARFQRPLGVVADSSGNVYVADTDNSSIRMITSAGVVSTFAGASGTSGSTDGIGTAARFAFPTQLAIDSANVIYVADYGNHTIRKIDTAGAVTTVAGSPGVSGSADGTGTAARFSHPWGVALDAVRNLYVADYENGTIRKISPAGVVTTVAGSAGISGSADGTGSAARFNFPATLGIDKRGNLFVADSSNHLVRKVTPGGVVTTIAGVAGASGFSDGVGAAVLFNYPLGTVVDGNGNVYIADYLNNRIRAGRLAPATVVGFTSILRPPTRDIFLTGLADPLQTVTITRAGDLSQPFIFRTTVQANTAGIFQFDDATAATMAKGFYHAQ